ADTAQRIAQLELGQILVQAVPARPRFRAVRGQRRHGRKLLALVTGARGGGIPGAHDDPTHSTPEMKPVCGDEKPDGAHPSATNLAATSGATRLRPADGLLSHPASSSFVANTGDTGEPSLTVSYICQPYGVPSGISGMYSLRSTGACASSSSGCSAFRSSRNRRSSREHRPR